MIMVRIVGPVQGGAFLYGVQGVNGVDGDFVDGCSREPLLDACRKLKRMGVSSGNEIGLFYPDRSDWVLRTTIGYGASQTVDERKQVRFRKFKEFPVDVVKNWKVA
jgi:hypothetical protein